LDVDIDYTLDVGLVLLAESKMATWEMIYQRIAQCGATAERGRDEGGLERSCSLFAWTLALENAKAGRKAVDEASAEVL
jgi:hypothetical protein